MSQGERQTKSEKEAIHTAHVRVVESDKDMTASTHHDGINPSWLHADPPYPFDTFHRTYAAGTLDDGYPPGTLCHTLVHRREEARQT